MPSWSSSWPSLYSLCVLSLSYTTSPVTCTHYWQFLRLPIPMAHQRPPPLDHIERETQADRQTDKDRHREKQTGTSQPPQQTDRWKVGRIWSWQNGTDWPPPWYGRQHDKHPVSAAPAEQTQRCGHGHCNKESRCQCQNRLTVMATHKAGVDVNTTLWSWSLQLTKQVSMSTQPYGHSHCNKAGVNVNTASWPWSLQQTKQVSMSTQPYGHSHCNKAGVNVNTALRPWSLQHIKQVSMSTQPHGHGHCNTQSRCQCQHSLMVMVTATHKAGQLSVMVTVTVTKIRCQCQLSVTVLVTVTYKPGVNVNSVSLSWWLT